MFVTFIDGKSADERGNLSIRISHRNVAGAHGGIGSDRDVRRELRRRIVGAGIYGDARTETASWARKKVSAH